MKKKLALLLSTVLVMSSVLVGCGGSNEAAQEETNNETTTQTTESETTEDTVAEGALKTGLAVTEGVPSDTDLAASVTLHIADFNNVIAKAAAAVK